MKGNKDLENLMTQIIHISGKLYRVKCKSLNNIFTYLDNVFAFLLP